MNRMGGMQYREELEEVDEDGMVPSNIMYDRRVIRGNTYAAQILPAAPPNANLAGPKRRKVREPTLP